jgi:hypothetical protein
MANVIKNIISTFHDEFKYQRLKDDNSNSRRAEIAPIHALSLSSHLLNLYNHGIATDVNVHYKNTTFKLHSSVLIHGSEYFQRILDCKEGDLNYGNDNDDTEEVELNQSYDDKHSCSNENAKMNINLEFHANTITCNSIQMHSNTDTHSAHCNDNDADEDSNNDTDTNINISPSILHIVIESLYTGIVRNMNPKNITSLLKACYHLEINHSYNACVDYMLQSLNLDNCLSYWLAGKYCDSKKIQTASIGLIGRHLDSFYTTMQFLELHSVIVVDILNEDMLQVCSENIVYEAVMAWIKYDVENRVDELSDLLGVVRMTYLPVFYLVNVVGKEDLIENDENAMGLYSKALKMKLGNSHHFKKRHNTIHAVRGNFEKMKKNSEASDCQCIPQIKARMMPRDRNDSDTDAKNDDPYADTDADADTERIDRDIGGTNEESAIESFKGFIQKMLPNKQKKNDVDENGNDEHSNDDDNNNTDEETKSEDGEESEKVRPKSFVERFFAKREEKKERNITKGSWSDVVNVDDFAEDSEADDIGRNSFSFERLEDVPEGSDEDLSESPSRGEYSKSGLSFSDNSKSNEKVIHLEMNPDDDDDAKLKHDDDSFDC